MSDFQTVPGFEDVWRPPVRPRRRSPRSILKPPSGGGDSRARLTRIVNRAPEVMVKVTGRTRDPGHLRAHLDYISRNGQIEVESADGWHLDGRASVREVADDWSAVAMADPRRREGAPFSRSLVLSMPQGTDPMVVRDAARAFANEVFGERFDYVFALHTDTPRPHVHIAVCSRGLSGERLNPKKADLEAWRQAFAQALRDRGVEAEASPRRARGVTRRAERMPVRKLGDRLEASAKGLPQVKRAAYQEAAKAAFKGDMALRAWERRAVERQAQIRRIYLAQAGLLAAGADPRDRVLAAQVARFVSRMPAPDSQRLALARDLRAANAERSLASPGGRDRSR